MELVAVNSPTHLHFSKFKITESQRQCMKVFVSYKFPREKCFHFNMGCNARRIRESVIAVPGVNYFFSGTSMKQHFAFRAVSSGLEGTQVSSSEFEEFSVTACKTEKANEVKISMVVAGTKTQAVFDEVFSAMVAEAQPIPGFRRVKGGKTPNIPKNILLEILGPSKVYKQVIKRIINSTMSDYVQKEGMSVGQDLRVEQSFEDLEAIFEPGAQLNFEATLQYQD